MSRIKEGWRRRAWAWCAVAARETGSGWRAAVALIRRDPWGPLALVVALHFLPALVMWRAPASAMLLSALRGFLTTPLMFAALARLHIAALRGGSARVVDTVRERAGQWRGLLPLALAGVVLAQMGAFVAEIGAQLLLAVLALIAWVPAVGTVVSVVFSALAMLFSTFCGLLFSQAGYLAWLTQEAEGSPAMLALPSAWRFLRARAQPIAGLFASLAAAYCILQFGLAGALGGDSLLWPALESVLVLLGAGYAAALFAGDRGAKVHDPYSAPVDLERMKRANVRED